MTEASENELEQWLERARTNPAEEQAFFRRLLEAIVFVHVPVSDDSGKVRLVQFRHPDGFDAVPFFTSREKALRASSPAVRVVGVLCRDLLEGSRGAIVMLNPNDGGAVLYPEEIASLLESGFLARVEKAETPWLHVRPAQSAPVWLGPRICACLQQADYVSAAYILETNPTEAWDQPPGLLICLVADVVLAERAARLVTSAIQPLCSQLGCIIDVTIHDATRPLPEHLDQPEVVPVFERDRPA